MKMCDQAVYAQVINNDGEVRLCGWAGNYRIGNLIDNSFEELFANEKTKKFMDSLSKKTYDYCVEFECPYQGNNAIKDHLIDLYEYPSVPKKLSLSYDNRCNYKCTCCPVHDNSQIDLKKQQKIENEIIKILPKVSELSANGCGEFFCSDSIIKVINAWEPKDKDNATFGLETNGSLFTPQNWNKIKKVGNYNLDVSITVMSFDEKDYQFLSGTQLPVSTIINNLRFVKELKDQGIVNHFTIATVVQERNFRTLPEFTHRCLEEFGADRVRIRRFLPQRAMDENIEWFFDVRNEKHPYHKEFLEVMSDPIFKNPRVFNWTGDHMTTYGEIPAEAGYKVLKGLYLTDAGNELGKYLISHGYKHIILYALGDICKATIDVLKCSGVTIDYILDAHSGKTEYNGYDVKIPVEKELVNEKTPILVTLVARHHEMVEYIRKRGYKGEILSLQDILDNVSTCEGC